MSSRLLVSFAFAAVFAAGCQKQPQSGPSNDWPTPTATPPPATPSPNASPGTPNPAVGPSASPSATPNAGAASSSPTALASPATATESDGRPKLSSQSANEYLQSYDAYIRDFKSAYTAMKQGDVSKCQVVIRRALELQTKSEKLEGGLNPEEEKRFADYLQKKENELQEFASQNR